jgi:hypothetical protein
MMLFTEDEAECAVDAYRGTREDAMSCAAAQNRAIGPKGSLVAVDFGTHWGVMLSGTFKALQAMGVSLKA